MNDFQNITVEYQGFTALVTLNRPAQLNALNLQTIRELSAVMDELEGKTELRCVILTGAGDKAFAAGADTTELENLDVDGALNLSDTGNRVYQKIQQLRLPVIAAVNGYALGGGCELALACDIRIAAETAVFGLPETTLGIYPGWGGTQRLARLVGYGRAAEMVFSAAKINASRAYEMGLVNQVVTLENLMEAAWKMAGKISACAPLAVQSAKKTMQAGLEETLNQGLLREAEGFGKLFDSQDCKQGLQAFNKREKYEFTGR